MVPEVYERGAKQPGASLALAFALCLAWAFPAAAQDRSLTRVVYEFAVTSYCGTLDPEVELGFRRELDAVTARGGYDAESAKRQRIRGWVAADEEWRNRGLGGNRAWCADEGRAAAVHFRAIARGEKAP